MFGFNFKNESGKLIVELEGDLDIEATEIIEGDLSKVLQNSSGEIELNFQGIDFVDSSGIGLLISLISSLKEASVKPTVTNLNEEVKMVFDLLQLDEIFGKDVVVG